MSFFEILSTIIAVGISLVVGLVGLFRPTMIRDYALRTSPRWTPFRGFMETRSYLWSLRLCGVLAMTIVVLLLAALVSGKR